MRSVLILALSALSLLSACQLPAQRPRTAGIAPPSVRAVRAWGFGRSDLTPDPDIRYGVLRNGMRYAIRRNTTPVRGASIRLRFDVGSTAEADDQRGLAHFLEHMAFNGSRRVPEGEMIKILERHGLAFGPDTNASTSFTQTVYSLDLPNAGNATLDIGLMLMREIAGELTIAPAAVDRERGVILSERRSRDQFSLRRLQHFIGFALPGAPVSRALPIGDPQVIGTAPADRIRDLYTRYYTPGRAAIVVVGNVDVRAVEAKIHARFSKWRGAGETAGDPVAAHIDPERPSAAAYFRDPDVPTSVSLFVIKPRDDRPDSVAQRRDDLLRTLANAIVSRRIARLARDADAAILGGGASNGEVFSTAEQSAITIGAKGDDWKSALGVADQELRRALQHGFTRAELAEQLANLRTGFENAARQADTRQSDALAGALAAAIEQDSVVTTPAYRLAMFDRLAPELTKDAVEAAFRSQWTGANPLVHVSGKLAIDDAEATILRALTASRATAVAALPDTGLDSFAYTDFGPAGTIAADARIADLGIRTIRFANNVRLSIKSTDFEKDRVRVSLSVGAGMLEFPADEPGLALFMNSVFSAGGLEKHSFDALQSMLAGRSVTLGLAASDDHFGGTVSTSPRDLALQMQLFAAFLTAPGFRSEADAQWQRMAPTYYDTLDASPGAIVGRDVGRILASGDQRFGVPPLDALMRRNMAELRAATAAAFRSGAIEIGIVGDVEEQAAIDMVARTLGALPMREAEPRRFAAARQVAFLADRAPVTLHHEGKADQAMTLAYWPTTDDTDYAEVARMSLLSAVMRLMLTDELRERLGATYSPGASSSMSDVYPGFGQFSIASSIDPKDAPAVEAAVAEIARALRDKPVDADLLLRARQPILERIERGRRENPNWLAIVDQAQGAPRYLDRFRESKSVYRTITAAELQAAARRYLQPDAMLRVRVMPEDVRTAP
jgi:zinc protease